jgi:UDP-N-acetylmuramyl pentapeptide synthase
MLRSILYLYRPTFGRTIVYMLQSAEYQPDTYLKWFWRVQDFAKVSYRKKLVPTKAAKMLLGAFAAGELATILLSAGLFIHGLANHSSAETFYALALLLAAPILWAHLIILPLVLGRFFIIKPSSWLRVQRSSRIFANHPGQKIAIAGSYGKTTLKEILLMVLSEGKTVTATPANKNVSISHANFAEKLMGDEEIMIIEYGEGGPGDIGRFARKTHPDVGIITGLAPAHLDKYKTLQAAGRDIFSLAEFVGKNDLYVNSESSAIHEFMKPDQVAFSSQGIAGWKVKNVKLAIDGLSFELSNKTTKLKIKSRLLGRHLIGPLSLAVYLANKYGLAPKQIETGVAKIVPFEHRMKPSQVSGAWIIDDTYNGNIEGVKAGLELLAELPAKRKIYITPGLVDQGADEEKIHRHIGEMIAKTNPDKVVLMKHSVTDAIVKGMEGYSGQLIIEDDPLEFYTNLDKFVAAGDIVLMQNDWPDNYN